jgi:tRNA-specific 2-thiouridylase
VSQPEVRLVQFKQSAQVSTGLNVQDEQTGQRRNFPMRVIAAMSGGVDSSVAAALLKEQGYDVIGVTLNVWPEHATDVVRADVCCSLSSVNDARRVAARIGIPHYTLNFRELFRRTVIADFQREYLRGRTPNPCVRCNQFIKFTALGSRARELGAEAVATGHYVRREFDERRGRWVLRRAVDRAKDQSYVLYVLTQEELARSLFPLGGYTKAAVRRMAAERGLITAHKPESQEICFVTNGTYADYLEQELRLRAQPGPIVDLDGNVLGEHQGIWRFTIGQRKGLGINAGRPLYVIAIDPASNTITVGAEDELYQRELIAEEPNFIALAELTEPVRVLAKVRYRMTEAPATIYPYDGGRVRVVFDEAQRAITPGQAVVFYDAMEPELLVGGATVAQVVRAAGTPQVAAPAAAVW